MDTWTAEQHYDAATRLLTSGLPLDGETLARAQIHAQLAAAGSQIRLWHKAVRSMELVADAAQAEQRRADEQLAASRAYARTIAATPSGEEPNSD